MRPAAPGDRRRKIPQVHGPLTGLTVLFSIRRVVETGATPAADPKGFWSWFGERQAEILDIVAGKREGRVTDLIDQALEAYGLQHLTYEVTGNGDGAELTFTPGGDPNVALVVDDVVGIAPAFERWRILGRIERKPLANALAFVQALHGLDISDARFKLVEHEDRYHLCFLHDALFALSEERRFAVASTFLDHALGEQFVMDAIGQLEFRPRAEGIGMGLLINELIADDPV